MAHSRDHSMSISSYVPAFGAAVSTPRGRSTPPAGSRPGDCINDVEVVGDAVCGAEQPDSPCLFRSGRPVLAEVQPQKQRVADVVAAGAGCRAVEVDDRDRGGMTEDE